MFSHLALKEKRFLTITFGIKSGDGCPQGRGNTEVPGTEMISVQTHAESRQSSNLEPSILPVRLTHHLLYNNIEKTYKYLLEINHKETSL